MQHALRPWVTASVVITGAGLIAAAPTAPQLGAAHRLVELTSGASAAFVDATQLWQNTEANWNALYPQGLEHAPNFFTDTVTPGVSEGLKALLTGHADTDVFSPLSLLTVGALSLTGPTLGLEAVFSTANQLSDSLTDSIKAGDFTQAFKDLGLLPTSLLNAYLNGASGSDDAAAFGLLTGNSHDHLATGAISASQALQKTLADMVAYAGGTHTMSDPLSLGTGSLAVNVDLNEALDKVGIDIPSSIKFDIPEFHGGGNTVDISLSSLNLPDHISYTIPKDVVGGQTVHIPLNLNLPDHISYTIPEETVGGNTIDIKTGFPSEISYKLPEECVFGHCIGGNTVSIPTHFPDHISYTLPEHTFGGQTVDIPLHLNLPDSIDYTIPETAVGGETVQVALPHVPDHISYTIPEFDFGGNTVEIPTGIDIPDSLQIPVHLDDLFHGSAVPAYIADLSKDLLAVSGILFGHIEGVDLTVANPVLEAGPLLHDLLASLNLPVSLDGDLSVDLTNVVAELLNTF
ncbi:hypothetical protein KIH27_17085 [Mycobacterium sp. M1]|uniref:PE-PGRS family protein n=1 Tax=Mycolicibacter acidiphilus TaxID=2835306 RepID=A0ABS5RMR1_9MYCO|nr:hypothetical protein [Mycolicibacter acidiphilus]MBS9535302.1 hypothetical protein [Mycolicibacter acidiphilus]